MMPAVPFIPETAPFTAEQRAYLNGFLAGLFSRTLPDGIAAGQLQPLTILYGSQTGNSEGLARQMAKEASRHGFAPAVFEMAKFAPDKLANESNLAIITSTYGDGEPPDNAKSFWASLTANLTKLSNLRFAVCALGDSNYPQFCAFGKAVDAQLEKLGAQRVLPRADCDVDYEQPFASWLGALWPAFARSPSVGQASCLSPAAPAVKGVGDGQDACPTLSDSKPPVPQYNRNNPFLAPLITNRMLNAEGSGKDTRHFAFSLADAGPSYEAGDALGVIPMNCPELVAQVLRALGFSGEEHVAAEGHEIPIREALRQHYEINRISDRLLKAFAEQSRDGELLKLVAPGVNGELTRFLHGRDILDLLAAFPDVKFTPAEFVALLRKLQPRLYSISSSPKTSAAEVHLTVAVVRYSNRERVRKGVCSAFLAERVPAASTVPLFVQKNKHFRPPADSDRPMIMVGPGTGIAPFRAFLQDRRATGAKGRNWLFFGDQHQATDFLYRDELEAMTQNGTLSRLDLAFSRDQAEKLYVQHRMLEHARELYAWLEDGAHFYVCGDASRMAKDVDAALHRVLEIGGQLTPEGAQQYVQSLSASKRYQRDVY